MFKQAKWVWVNAKSDVNQYVESVEKFQVEEEGSYTLAISVTGNYCIFHTRN